MKEYSKEEISAALQVVSTTIGKCERIQPEFTEGTSQHTLLKNRIKALYIAKTLLAEDGGIERYSKEELLDALRPIASVISKCKTGQRKHVVEAPPYKHLQKIIDAMSISETLITDEISKREI